MKESKIYCDHCGEELDGVHDYTDIELDLYSEWFNVDLCDERLQEIHKLNQVINNINYMIQPIIEGKVKI